MENNVEKSYQSIFENKNVLATLFDNDPTGILIIDPETRKIIDGNKSALEMISMPKNDVIGNVCHNFVCPADRDKCPICDLNQTVDRSERLLLRNGRAPIPILKTVVLIKLEEKEYLLESFIDITEHKQAEQKVKNEIIRRRVLFEQATDGIVVFDSRLNVVEANRSFAEMLGYAVNEVPLIDIAVWDTSGTLQEIKAQWLAMKIDSASIVQTKLRSKSGRQLDVEVSTSVVELATEKQLFCVFRDVTHRNQMIEVLAERENRLRTLYETLPVMIWLKNIDGVYLSCNPMFERFFGANEREIIGKTDYDYVDKETADVFREYDRRAIASGTASSNEEEVVFADDGHYAWLETIKTPMYDENGSLVGILGIAYEITERKKHETAIQRSAEIQIVLREIVEAALLSTSLNGLFAAVHQLVKRILPARNFFVSLLDGVNSQIVRPYCVDELDFIPAQRPLGRGITEYIMRMGRAIHIKSADISHLREKGEIDIYLPPNCEFIAAPLRDSQGNFLGAVALYSIGDTHFLTEDMELFSIVAAQVSMAIERKRAEDELSRRLEQLKSSWQQTIRLLSNTAEVRDPYTAGHQKRVATLAAAIGRSMDSFTEEGLQGLTMAAMLHDIGKITVPSEILSKPGKISAVEFELIKTHCQAGYDLLKQAELPWNIAEIIHQHHERINGSGYPRGLVGQDILIEARIIAVADVVEAMSAHRPYRPGLGLDVSLQEIENNAGLLYDQDVVKHCLDLFRERSFTFEDGLND